MLAAPVRALLPLLLLAPAALPFGDDTAQYTVVFDATWSAATHPQDFPPSPHFSPLIGGTHDATVSFWTPGQTASDGIEFMAELGVTGTLTSEINAAIATGQAGTVITGGSIFPSPGTANASFTIDLAHPEVTLVSMIAPSPDWFVGVADLPLFENGDWVDSKVVSLLPWDAGTDNGVTFTSPNSNTNPADPITALTGFPFTGTGPLGTFTFTRTDDPTDPWADLGFALVGSKGLPVLVGDGSLCASTTLSMTLTNALENTTAWLAAGVARIDAPFQGGVFVPDIFGPGGLLIANPTGPTGTVDLSVIWPAGLPSGTDIYAQFWIADAGAIFGYAGSNAITKTTP